MSHEPQRRRVAENYFSLTTKDAKVTKTLEYVGAGFSRLNAA